VALAVGVIVAETVIYVGLGAWNLALRRSTAEAPLTAAITIGSIGLAVALIFSAKYPVQSTGFVLNGVLLWLATSLRRMSPLLHTAATED